VTRRRVGGGGALAIATALASITPLIAGAAAQWPQQTATAVDLKAPPPRTRDGKPDLSGVWMYPCTIVTTCFQQGSIFFDLTFAPNKPQIQMTPWAAGVAAQREARDHVDDPMAYCMPAGYPRIGVMYPFKIVMSDRQIVFLHESAVGNTFREVFMDGRPLPTDAAPTWLGYSVGRWEGDTLVVETSGFRDGGWLDTRKGRPHSDALRVTDRFRRLSVGQLEWSFTITDPKAYVRPFTVTTPLNLLPGSELFESFCETHDKTMEHRRISPPPPEPPSPPLP
jgi:hypothetical protein